VIEVPATALFRPLPMAAMRIPRDDSVLSCRGLRQRLDDNLVDDVWFDIQAGEAYGLTGPDSAARAMIVRVVCGLLGVDRGAVLLRGRPVDELDAQSLRESVGYVAQSVATWPSMTVVDNLRLWARLLGLPLPLRRRRIAEVLAKVGLDAHSCDLVENCSAGVLRDLSIAVALLHRPRLLVLDEPTEGIDGPSRQRLLATLRRLCDEGMSVLYVSGDTAEVHQLCDRVGVLVRGRLIAEGSPDSVPLPAA
jgi:ABC-type multidrug transport system ATPase subunit